MVTGDSRPITLYKIITDPSRRRRNRRRYYSHVGLVTYVDKGALPLRPSEADAELGITHWHNRAVGRRDVDEAHLYEIPQHERPRAMIPRSLRGRRANEPDVLTADRLQWGPGDDANNNPLTRARAAQRAEMEAGATDAFQTTCECINAEYRAKEATRRAGLRFYNLQALPECNRAPGKRRRGVLNDIEEGVNDYWDAIHDKPGLIAISAWAALTVTNEVVKGGVFLRNYFRGVKIPLGLRKIIADVKVSSVSEVVGESSASR